MLVILIDPDADERDLYLFMLRRMGFQVMPFNKYDTSIDTWLENPAELVLHASENYEDLLKWTMSFRAVTDTPLILISNELGDRQLAKLLMTGSDLVLQRPISYFTLEGYIRALLRRAGRVPTTALPTLNLETISLNPGNRIVTQPNRNKVQLTQLEFRLLYILMTNRDQVLPFETLIERVWGYSGTGSKELVRGLISRLRSKIELNPKKPMLIQTIPSSGYMFTLGEQQ